MSAGTMYPLSLSDLKALTPGSNSNDRYYLTDLGKEGEFYLYGTYPVSGGPPPNTADDAIFVNSSTISGNIYQYKRIIESGMIDVRWFGANGDSSTDQTTALQAALTTTYGNTIVFDVPGGGSFKINTVTVTIATGKVLKFLPGNMLIGTATLNGGIIDAGYRQQIWASTLTIAPAGCMNNMVSAMWFGAGAAGVGDSQPAIQKIVDMVIVNTALPKTIFFPRGTYTINAPIIIANYDSVALIYRQSTVLLKGEEPGNNRISGTGAVIYANFKDRFAIGFQIGKSGGLESLSIVGLYTVPSMATDAFFNNNDFSTYGDPTCRDSRYSPYCAVAIDPFRYDSLPIDGGYPGNDGYGVALSTYYTKAINQPNTTSGSTGLYFKDLYIANFTVCVTQTPNGETLNGEEIIYEEIQVANCKLGFASAQAQEKSNSYSNIMCWGTTHTVFSNQDYGFCAQSGNVVIDNVNIAGGVNRVLNWNAAGWFPSYFKNFYAESLGAFGNLLSAGMPCSVEDSLFDFVSPTATGDYYPSFHVNTARSVTFTNCMFRIYGTGFPIILTGSGVFEECTFETPPVTRIEEGFSSGDTAQFYNCQLSFTSAKMGSRELLRGSINQFGQYMLYGNYSLTDATAEINNVYGQYFFNFYKVRELMNIGLNNVALTISGATRTYTFTSTSLYAKFVIGEPVVLIQGALVIFGGLVTAINTGTGVVTVSYVPASVTSGTYSIFPYPYLKPFRIIGDLTYGSTSVTNVVSGGFPGAVGDCVFLPELGGFVRILTISGTTYTFSSNSFITKTGVTLTPPAIQYIMNSQNPNVPLALGPNVVFKKGDLILDTSLGLNRKYICIADGMFNPSDGRIAYFTLNGNQENTFTGTGSIHLPAGFLVEGFILNAAASQSAVTIGTTSGGTDISSGLALAAAVSKVQAWQHFTDAVTTIYFGGITGSINIKTIIKSA